MKSDFQGSGFDGSVVQDRVLAYRTPAGAHWQFRVSAQAATRSPYKGARFVRMSTGRLGDEVVGYEWIGASNGIKLTMFIIMFRRGVYDALVISSGLTGVTAPDNVIHLAHVIDGRMPK